MPISHPRAYAVNGLLAAGVLYWVLDLSASGRGPIDYAVIALLGLAILWNLVGLGRHLVRRGRTAASTPRPRSAPRHHRDCQSAPEAGRSCD
ncbi:MAG: hypothetical protein R2882_06305 [Gemmatimonadales bacterium]